ncbi:hypothetical protein GCM10007973_30920 [Polymorphobacter multimanifer]|uniref:Peroxiredoxin n=1 Tax=Polymorphobacter multimanifer TaxID=1070431 RepID=A0A841L917_9SPHN|nr:peroxiredoxin family protein [Polymorphobacter multimanifer]MBB6228666.1 peroxiredoxin [Polymorphobacter multimanifer]GGI92473.1 hypothetical protein GCM10007973_30920 [Polymorphobacter multimanifer]
MLRTLAIAAALITAPAAAIPAVGEKAPPLDVHDSRGRPQTLQSLQGSAGTVLVFFQSASWSPYSKAQLGELNAQAAAPLAARGYNLVALSYDPPAFLNKLAEERNIKWPLLSDIRSRVIDAWQLRDPQFTAGSRAVGVARPAIFVIGRDGIIKARLMEEDSRVRPSVEAVLAAAN